MKLYFHLFGLFGMEIRIIRTLTISSHQCRGGQPVHLHRQPNKTSSFSQSYSCLAFEQDDIRTGATSKQHPQPNKLKMQNNPLFALSQFNLSNKPRG